MSYRKTLNHDSDEFCRSNTGTLSRVLARVRKAKSGTDEPKSPAKPGTLSRRKDKEATPNPSASPNVTFASSADASIMNTSARLQHVNVDQGEPKRSSATLAFASSNEQSPSTSPLPQPSVALRQKHVRVASPPLRARDDEIRAAREITSKGGFNVPHNNSIGAADTPKKGLKAKLGRFFGLTPSPSPKVYLPELRNSQA